MTPCVVLSRVDIVQMEESAVLERYGGLRKLWSEAPGYELASLWMAEGKPWQYTAVVQFRCEDEASEAMGAVIRSGELESLAQQLGSTVDTARLNLIRSGGETLRHAMVGGFLSVSRRIADPGRADELVEDLEAVFGSLAVLDGLKGWAVYSQADIPEVVFGFAFWNSPAEFERSLPSKSLYEVNLLRRIG